LAKRETDLREYAKTPELKLLIGNATYEMYVLWQKKRLVPLREDQDAFEEALERAVQTFVGLPEVIAQMDFFCGALTNEEQRAMLLYTGILEAKDREGSMAA
jgi:hypothetical protein